MQAPSLDKWLEEARRDEKFSECGMYLFHNGVVRRTPKALARLGNDTGQDVFGMDFSYDAKKVSDAIEKASRLPGIFYIRVWLNEGRLSLGDTIMLVLIGGDIRPHVVDALNQLVGQIKDECVTETEILSAARSEPACRTDKE